MRELIDQIWRWKWAGLLVVLVVLGATVAYVEWQWQQVATATAELRHQGPRELPLGQLLGESAPNSLTADTLTMRSAANFEVLGKLVTALDRLPEAQRRPAAVSHEGDAPLLAPSFQALTTNAEAAAAVTAAASRPARTPGAPGSDRGIGGAAEAAAATPEADDGEAGETGGGSLFPAPADSFRGWLILDYATGRPVEARELEARVESLRGNLLLIRPDDRRLLAEAYWGVGESTRAAVCKLAGSFAELTEIVSTSANADARTIRVQVTHPDPAVAVFLANALPVAFNAFAQRKAQLRRSLTVGIAESSLTRARHEWSVGQQELDREIARVNERLAAKAQLINAAGLEPAEIARMVGNLNSEWLMLEWQQHVLRDQRIQLEQERLALLKAGWIDPATKEIDYLDGERERLLREGRTDVGEEVRALTERLARLREERRARSTRITSAAERLQALCDRLSALPLDDPARVAARDEFDEAQRTLEEAMSAVWLDRDQQAARAALRREARELRAAGVELERQLEITREKLAELNVQRDLLAEENRAVKLRQAQVQALFDRMIQAATLLQEAQLGLASDTTHSFDWQQTASRDLVSHSSPAPLLASGSILALLLGLATIVVLHQLDRRLVSTWQLGRLTSLPILGRVPKLKRRDLDVIDAARDDEPLRPSQFHPALAPLAYNLAHAMRRAETGGMMCLITSSVPGEGKSLVSRMLAALYAAKGLRTCLLLGDCHQVSDASLTLLAERTGPGYATVCRQVTGRGREQAFARCVLPTRIPGLSLVVPGDEDVDANALFESAGFAAFTAYLRQRFDVVLIDSPPVSLSTDPMTLGRLVDTVLLAVRAGKVEVEGVSHTLNQLAFVGLPTAGIVFNDLRYERRYSYGYGYDPHPERGKRHAAAAAVAAAVVSDDGIPVAPAEMANGARASDSSLRLALRPSQRLNAHDPTFPPTRHAP